MGNSLCVIRLSYLLINIPNYFNIFFSFLIPVLKWKYTDTFYAKYKD